MQPVSNEVFQDIVQKINAKGAKAFSKRILKGLCDRRSQNSNRYLYRFFMDELEFFEVEPHERSAIKVCIAVMISSLSNLPHVTLATLDGFDEQLNYLSPSEDERLSELFDLLSEEDAVDEEIKVVYESEIERMFQILDRRSEEFLSFGASFWNENPEFFRNYWGFACDYCGKKVSLRIMVKYLSKAILTILVLEEARRSIRHQTRSIYSQRKR